MTGTHEATTLMFKLAPAAAFLTALSTGQYVDENDTMQIGVGTLTRFATFVHQGERYAVFSTDKNAPRITQGNVQEIPDGVMITEFFGAISFGKTGQFVIGYNKTQDDGAKQYFDKVVKVAYHSGDTYRSGSFALLAIVDRNLVPIYNFVDQNNMIDVTDKLSGIEIVTMNEETVERFGVKIDGKKTARVVQMNRDQLIGYLLEGQDIDWKNFEITTIPKNSLLTQAPNGKVACTDRSEARLMVIGDSGLVLDTIDLPSDTMLVKVALTDAGIPQTGFVTVVVNEDGRFRSDSVTVAEFLGVQHAIHWTGLPQTAPEVGATTNK